MSGHSDFAELIRISVLQGAFDRYTETVKRNLGVHEDRWDFKSDATYTYILEHLSQKEGEDYLALIKKEFNDLYVQNKDRLIELAQLNDKYGSPTIFNITDFTMCSPTNLRYIYHCFLILEFANSRHQNEIDIVEIGGGYGGLCYYLYNLAYLFDVKIKSYTMFDIPAVCKLQKKYLNNLDIEIQADGVDDFQLQRNSFLISNYAFSELPEDTRNKYSDLIINEFTSHGFLGWNSIDLYDFVDNSHITSHAERPTFGPKHQFVYFWPREDASHAGN